LRKFIFFGVGLAGLAGLVSCGPNPREAANQEYQQLLADCQSEYADQPPTMEKFQSCKNYAEGATIDAFIPTTDLTALGQADRLEIAREADTGEITVEEADEKMAELGVQLDQTCISQMRAQFSGVFSGICVINQLDSDNFGEVLWNCLRVRRNWEIFGSDLTAAGSLNSTACTSPLKLAFFHSKTLTMRLV